MKIVPRTTGKFTSKNATKTLNKYVPSIKVKNTVWKSRGLGLSIIQAKILNIVLSTKEDNMVERLFQSHKNMDHKIKTLPIEWQNLLAMKNHILFEIWFSHLMKYILH